MIHEENKYFQIKDYLIQLEFYDKELDKWTSKAFGTCNIEGAAQTLSCGYIME